MTALNRWWNVEAVMCTEQPAIRRGHPTDAGSCYYEAEITELVKIRSALRAIGTTQIVSTDLVSGERQA